MRSGIGMAAVRHAEEAMPSVKRATNLAWAPQKFLGVFRVGGWREQGGDKPVQRPVQSLRPIATNSLFEPPLWDHRPGRGPRAGSLCWAACRSR